MFTFLLRIIQLQISLLAVVAGNTALNLIAIGGDYIILASLLFLFLLLDRLQLLRTAFVDMNF